jgi:hypothetical protein
MSSDRSLLGQIRARLGIPSKLEKTRTQILQAERNAPNNIGSWTCMCGHPNAIYHLPPPALHPLGYMSCRVCSSTWHPGTDLEITSQTTTVNITSMQNTETGRARVLSTPPIGSSSFNYVCLGPGCGLTWRTDIKTEWFSGRKRQLLLIDGKRGKCQCICGMRIFEMGSYEVFEVV